MDTTTSKNDGLDFALSLLSNLSAPKTADEIALDYAQELHEEISTRGSVCGFAFLHGALLGLVDILKAPQ